MRYKLIMMAMAVLLLAPSFCYAGIPEDKQKHIGVAAGLDAGMTAAGVKKETRWSIMAGLIIGKEIYDHNKSHSTHDRGGDILAGVGGVVAAEGVIWLWRKDF